MSLQRIEKIYCYAKPCKSHLQLLSSKPRMHPRGIHSETLIQRNNFISPKSGDSENRNSYIESLCKSFDLSCATNHSPFGNLTRDKKKEEEPISVPVNKEPCKKCAKIRSNIRKFFNTKFATEIKADETETGVQDKPRTVPMHIHIDERNQITLVPDCYNIKPHTGSKPHKIENTVVCFGCDQPQREPSIRGPPIISPVCHVNASPTGEVYKNFPESVKSVKKIVKIDRPRSLGLKRPPQNYQPSETSVHETKKQYGR
ncbi:uncharacterized protein LOC119078542 [Bradysia coprophila]|uniref:uncharacterized protein LOC119078542 n=1 Tax=Bradysia coprophila TaxID=38358 RepID=UPI00187D76FD|nr:uncharacterized protein LOC119078542 [Bradysia coprophila]